MNARWAMNIENIKESRKKWWMNRLSIDSIHFSKPKKKQTAKKKHESKHRNKDLKLTDTAHTVKHTEWLTEKNNNKQNSVVVVATVRTIFRARKNITKKNFERRKETRVADWKILHWCVSLLNFKRRIYLGTKKNWTECCMLLVHMFRMKTFKLNKIHTHTHTANYEITTTNNDKKWE